jgi:hypothetical protein
LRAAATDYAQRCTAAVDRLETCCGAIDRGEMMTALRVAESWPPLREVIRYLNDPGDDEWRTRCADLGLAIDSGFPAEKLGQLVLLYAGASTLIPVLYRDYRGLVMQQRESEALGVIRTIARLRPDDADAQAEKARLEEKATAALTAGIDSATAMGRSAEAATLSDELADFRNSDGLDPNPIPAVSSDAIHAAATPEVSTAIRTRAGAVRSRPVARPTATGLDPLQENPAKARRARPRLLTTVFTLAGLSAVAFLAWLAIRPGPPQPEAGDAAAAIINCRTARELRDLGSLAGSGGKPPAEMLKAIREQGRPGDFRSCLAQLRQLEREFGSSASREPALLGMFRLLEQEASEFCTSSRTRPSAFGDLLSSSGGLSGYQWKDSDTAGYFRTLAAYTVTGDLRENAIPASRTTPVWVGAEIAAAKATVRPPPPPAVSVPTDPLPDPETSPALDDASVARLSILSSWESLGALRPGSEWLESMAVIPRHQSRTILTRSTIGFVGPGRLAADFAFSVQEGAVAKRSRSDLLGIDLIGGPRSGVWRIYCAASPGFAEVCTSLANPFADHSLDWDPVRSEFQLSEATTAFMKRFRLLTGQSWQIEFPFPVNSGGARTLPISAATVPFPLHSSQKQRSSAPRSSDPVLKALKARMIAEKQKLARSIRMQETSADKDPIANSQRNRRIQEYHEAFDEIMRGLKFEMDERIRALEAEAATPPGIPQVLPGNGPFHVSISMGDAPASLLRLLELTPRP